MKLGAFSVSLNVKDIGASRTFYENLGFSVFGGEETQGWLILQNPDGHTLGLFQGMLEKNTLTFNPGWSQRTENLDEFTDIREMQKQIKASGIAPVSEVDEASEGPGSMMLMDPDGNPVLVDQHR